MADIIPIFESMIDLDSFNGGEFIFKTNQLKSRDFKKEVNLESYIISNIKKFVKDVLGDTLISYNKQLSVFGAGRGMFGPRPKTIDLFIKGHKHTYIIELKNPSCQRENVEAIGQILDYGRYFPDPDKKLVIITTHFDINTIKTIQEYNLPIEYIYMDKRRVIRYIGEYNG